MIIQKKTIQHPNYAVSWIYLIVCLGCMHTLFSQVQFEARVSRNSLPINERLRVDFIMNQDGDNFNPPSFENFRLVGGPSQSVNFSWINGKKSYDKIYSYFLMPLQKGSITIKQASIEIDGQIYKTSPITINVTSASEQQKDPNNVEYTVSDGVHLVAEVSKTNPYLNEPISVVYKLYVSPRVSVRNWKEIAVPKFNDFWSHNIEIKDLNVEEGKYKGEDYRFVTLRKTILYPQKSGELIIDPLSLDVAFDVPTNRRDFFGRPVTTVENKTISASRKSIQVKPLPEQGKPIGFSGAVGTFNFTATTSKTALNHGESLDLEIKVSGKGNMKLFSLPKPTVPSALEMYEPVHTENISTNNAGSSGSIIDRYTIIPQYQGNFPIKAMAFTYFDIESKTYKVITSKDIIINVANGPTSGENTTEISPNGVAKITVNQSKQFKYIKSDTQLTTADTTYFFGSWNHILLVLLPFGIIPLLLLIQNKRNVLRSDVVGSKIRQSNKLAKKYLSDAKQNINNKDLFYIALEKALHNFVKAKLHIETSEMQKDTIKATLIDKQVSEDMAVLFIQLLQNCEFARYSPVSDMTMQNDYDKAITLLSELSKKI